MGASSEGGTETRGGRSGYILLVLHGLCFLLVIFYVNMFQFWAWLSRALGPGMLAKLLPILVTFAVLLVVTFKFIQRVNRGYRIQFVFLGLGIITAFLALAIPDPSIPIKRIHVAEYILLSFAVRYVLSHRLQGANLLIFTGLVTAMYGIHDEMLQGLHPLRYYGWRDMIVNGVAGLSGAMLGHGLLLFAEQQKYRILARQRPEIPLVQGMLFACLIGAVIWQIIYLYYHRSAAGIFMPVPVVVCCLVIGWLDKEVILRSTRHHGMQAIYWLAFGLAAYPLLAKITGIEFL